MADTEQVASRAGKESLIDPIYQKFVKGVIRAIGSTDFYEFFMDAIAHAQNEFQFSNRKLQKIVDITWVDSIEETLKAFQNIVDNPLNVIKEEELIVNVANAKKAGPETVRHLAQHSNLVEDFDFDTGDMRPGRLMQRFREDFVGRYENRLVFTTMEYAFRFVKIRYDALFEAMSEEFGAKLKVKSDLDSSKEHVHMDLYLHIRQNDNALETDEKNAEVFARISKLYRVLGVLMNSQFAQQLSKQPRIKGKVNKTNVLKKNKDYKKVLALFETLRKYESIGYSIKVIEQAPVVDEKLERDIYHSILFNYLSLKGYLEDEADRSVPTAGKEKRRTLKPKFIRQIIEELTEDYDLPDVEVRKVLIEELTKAQLLKEEEKERRRLVAEREQRKQEEAERIRAEKAAERERIRAEKEAERERIRGEKEAERQRLMQERMERELEDRRRSALFRDELQIFEGALLDRLYERDEQKEERKAALVDFADAAEILEQEEQRRREEKMRLRQLRQEEHDRILREQLLARQREKEAAQRAQEALSAAEEQAQKEAEELASARLAAQIEQDKQILKPVIEEVTLFSSELMERLALRVAKENERALSEEQFERHRRERRARKAMKQ